jgi:hypothetical protein
LAGGLLFANLTVSKDIMNDPWYSRPDLKPFPAMIPKEDIDPMDRQVLEAHYQKYRNERNKELRKKSSWYRLFFPNNADYTPVENPYAHTHRHNVYNPTNCYYPSVTNQFRKHLNE